MKLHRRWKRSTKQYIIVAFICITVIGGAAAFTAYIITNQIKQEYSALLKDAYKDMELNQRNVYVAVSDILTGEVIDAEKVEKKTVYSSQPLLTYITNDQLGKTALIDIPAGTQILNTMITEHSIADELREMEYDVIYMNSNIMNNDMVDVRIFYPNGESYVVLSKKAVKGMTPDTAQIYLWLDEEELLRMSAAIVDAGLYPGSKLYVTKYIEPNIQEASVVNYIPSLSILSLIENDPNIVERCSQELNKEVRKALENRLADSMATDVSSISWEVSSDNSSLQQEVTKKQENSSSEQEVEVWDNTEGDIQKETGKETEKETEKNTGNSQLQEEAKWEDTGTEKEAFNLDEPPQTGIHEVIGSETELGARDFFYYAEEAGAKDGVIEYGE